WVAVRLMGCIAADVEGCRCARSSHHRRNKKRPTRTTPTPNATRSGRGTSARPDVVSTVCAPISGSASINAISPATPASLPASTRTEAAGHRNVTLAGRSIGRVMISARATSAGRSRDLLVFPVLPFIDDIGLALDVALAVEAEG